MNHNRCEPVSSFVERATSPALLEPSFRVLNIIGRDDLAHVYIADFGRDKIIEFVESLQPPIPREEKWVLIISTSFGCPVKCIMCDAGNDYKGKLSTSQIIAQIDYLVLNRYPDSNVPVKKFKIQFARMGEPALNLNVLDVLHKIHRRYDAPGIMPCISTIGPSGAEQFFEDLLAVKNDKYSGGKFQLQFSVHSTDANARDMLMPFSKWSLCMISEYGKRFYQTGDRKITLNFALAQGIPLDPQLMGKIFSPDNFMIKITPVNPTFNAIEKGLQTYILPTDLDRQYEIIDQLKKQGFETLISIGENEENLIGSNCGQYITGYQKMKKIIPDSYTYARKSR